jgi:hypothetical protein
VWDISAPGQFGTCGFFFDFTYKTSNYGNTNNRIDHRHIHTFW